MDIKSAVLVLGLTASPVTFSSPAVVGGVKFIITAHCFLNAVVSHDTSGNMWRPINVFIFCLLHVVVRC